MDELVEHIEGLQHMNERLRAVKLALACRDFEQRATRQEHAWRREHPVGFVPWSIAVQVGAARPSTGD